MFEKPEEIKFSDNDQDLSTIGSKIMSRKRLRIFEKITKKKLSLSQQFSDAPSDQRQQEEAVADLKKSFTSDASEISVEDAMTAEPHAGFLCIKV